MFNLNSPKPTTNTVLCEYDNPSNKVYNMASRGTVETGWLRCYSSAKTDSPAVECGIHRSREMVPASIKSARAHKAQA